MMQRKLHWRLGLLLLCVTLLLMLVALPATSNTPDAPPPARVAIRLQRAQFDPLTETPPLPTLLAAESAGNVYLVQFEGPILPEWKAGLTQLGAVVGDYVPEFAFIVQMDARVAAQAAGLDGVRWVDAYRPAYRLDTALDSALMQPANAGNLALTVRAFPGAEQAALAGLGALGGKVTAQSADSGGGAQFQAILPASTLLKLAALEALAWVAPRPTPRLLNAVARSAVALDKDGVERALGLYGAGQIVVMGDTGVSTGNAATMHPDFRGHFYKGSWGSGVCGSWSDYDSHGTHTAGSAVGNGAQSGANLAAHAYAGTNAGIAPEALLWAWGFCSDWSGLPDLNPYTQYYGVMYADDPRARISSNSWGYDSPYGSYDSYSRETDRFIWDHPDMVVVFAAGNDGIDANADGVVDSNSTGVPAAAKNIITVGASENYRLTGGASNGYAAYWGADFPAEPLKSDRMSNDPAGMVAFSGRGPTLDGRLKPDVVAPGSNIVSTRYQGANTGWGIYDSNYLYMGGTSMAAPLVAGASAVVREFYTKTYSLNPSAALVKATLINGAVDIAPGQYRDEFPNGSKDDVLRRPDTNQGWGRVNLRNSLVYTYPNALWFEDNAGGLATAGVYETAFTITSNERPLRVTLVWADYPGAEAANGALVNDLDLEVSAPGGALYRGNDLLGDGVWDGDVDRVNNVEGVDLPGQPGTYIARVKGYNVPQGPQPFALLISGVMGRLGYLEGYVTDPALAPISGALVEAITGTVRYLATTDASGYYTLPVAADVYTVSAWKYGYAQVSVSEVAALFGGVAAQDFVLSPAAVHTLTGCVTDAVTGQPLAATLALSGPLGQGVTQTVASAVDGCYAFNLYAATYTLRAEMRLHETADFIIPLTGAHTRHLVLTPTTTAGLLWGYVTEAETAAPLPGALVTLQPGALAATADTAGYYELEAPPGVYTATVSAPLYGAHIATLAISQSNLLRRDYALTTAQLAFVPSGGLTATLALTERITATLAISNGGAGALLFSTLILPGAAPYGPRAAAGPDGFGYIYRDSTAFDGPMFSWLDTAGAATLDLADDGAKTVTLPFAFDFYGLTATQLRISNNGAALFGAGDGSVYYVNTSLTSASYNYLIAPFWDDFDASLGNVFTKTLGAPGARRFVVTWQDRSHWEKIGAVTLQMILYEGSNNLKFQYQDVNFGDARYNQGASATVGIRKNSTAFLEYAYNTAAITDGLAICFQYPGASPCDVQSAPWLTATPGSGVVNAKSVLPLILTLDAAETPGAGVYSATLRAYSNAAAAQPYRDYPVNLTVLQSGLGVLQGVVLDATGVPLPGARAEARRSLHATPIYSATTDAMGAYRLTLPAGQYTLHVSAEGYRAAEQTAVVQSDLPTYSNVALTPFAPAITVTPLSLAAIQYPRQVTTQTLTISNTGDASLTFTLTWTAAPSLLAASAMWDAAPLEVDSQVLAALAAGGTADFWVRLRQGADVRAAHTFANKAARGAYVRAALRAAAEQSQAEARAYLEKRGLRYEPHWIINAILVHEGAAADVAALAALPGVREIRGRFSAQLVDAVQPATRGFYNTLQALAVEPAWSGVAWGLTFTYADQVWARGIDGAGIVVANLDTGVQWNHPALIAQYRGSAGDHNYAWYAPTITATTACSGAATAPCDWHNHGTHTMGTMVGWDSAANARTGMAPGATWIACMGCDNPPNDCTDAALINCAEWVIAPTDLAGNNPDPAKAPHIVNNSWGDAGGDAWYQAYVQAWVAAGIFPAFSAGNYGSGCSTIGSPADYPEAFATASVDSDGNAAASSSRGPAPFGVLKPDLAAPGVRVLSTLRSSNYGYMSGTSMASPHTAGAAALMWAANPTLRGDVARTAALLRETVNPAIPVGNCGAPGAAVAPNYTYGYGYLDALAAVEAARALLPQPWFRTAIISGVVAPGAAVAVPVVFDAADRDVGVYTGVLSIIHNAVMPTATLPVTLTVLDPFRIAPLPAAQLGLPGVMAAYQLWVTNTTALTDTLTFSVADGLWPATLAASELLLPGGATLPLTVTVAIPGDASPGLSASTVITATSARYGVARVARLTTQIYPYRLFLPLLLREGE